MALTLAQVQALVKLKTKEPSVASPIFATDANILTYVNLYQLELARDCKSKTASNLPNSTSDPAVSTVVGQRLYDFPTNLNFDVYKIYVNGWDCEYKTQAQLAQIGGYRWWAKQGLPRYYYFEDFGGTKKFGLWWTPGGVWPIAIMGNKRPTDATQALATTVLDLDERLHKALVFGVCQSIMEDRREIDKARYWQSLYELEVKKYGEHGDDTAESSPFLNDSFPSD